MTDISVIILVGKEKIHMRRCMEKLAPLEPSHLATSNLSAIITIGQTLNYDNTLLTFSQNREYDFHL